MIPSARATVMDRIHFAGNGFLAPPAMEGEPVTASSLHRRSRPLIPSWIRIVSIVRFSPR